jgi:clan AA aspartic protease (TIGR02281 family)
MDLPTFLLRAGFRQVPLSRTGVGHFQTAGQLNGRTVAVRIDTGAASTVFNLALAQALGLTLHKAPHQGGGAGAARLDIY